MTYIPIISIIHWRLTMYQYRNDPLYPTIEPSVEAMERAMIRGRKLRARAFRDNAVALHDGLDGALHRLTGGAGATQHAMAGCREAN